MTTRVGGIYLGAIYLLFLGLGFGAFGAGLANCASRNALMASSFDGAGSLLMRDVTVADIPSSGRRENQRKSARSATQPREAKPTAQLHKQDTKRTIVAIPTEGQEK